MPENDATREVDIPLLGILQWYRETCLPGWLLSSHEVLDGARTVRLHLVAVKKEDSP